MPERVCPGCGAPLQSEDPEAPGFVPAEVLERDEPDTVCRRCFRLRHYGDVTHGPPAPAAVWAAVKQAAAAADCVLLVADAFDFEASMSLPLRDLRGRRLLVAVNKIDLLPARTPLPEVERWVRGRLADAGLLHTEVHFISARTGWGTRALWERLKELVGRGTVAVLGVTNVGKSALLARWSRALGNEGPAPTVSAVPGTTLALLRLRLEPDGFALLDTPGIPPEGRISDRLCPDCARRIVPDKRLNGQLWPVAAGQALLMGGFAAIIAPSAVPEGTVLIAYGAQGLPLHRTRAERAAALLHAPSGPIAAVPCGRCRARFQADGFAEHTVTLRHAQDLVIHGLGWVTLRGGPLELAVQLPRGVKWTVRPNLLGPKDRVAAQRSTR
ncbi:MAG TPA: GTPase [Limnochordales bacterium]